MSSCVVEYTDEFYSWWVSLSEDLQDSIAAAVNLLAENGVNLGDPTSSQIKGSKVRHMRELKVQHGGKPYRVFYAFDPRRCAILLIGGMKEGDDRQWYRKMVPIAERIYLEHLAELEQEADR